MKYIWSIIIIIFFFKKIVIQWGFSLENIFLGLFPVYVLLKWV